MWYRALAIALLAAVPATAGPVVEFNADYVVACRVVTPEEYARKYPDKKLVEATLRISARLLGGSEKDLESVVYTLSDPNRRLHVADYAPKTELATDAAEPLLAIEYQGAASVRYALTQQAGFITGKYQASKVKYRKLPPLEALVASGITERGYGVFFKLRPSDRVTLEGDRQVSCLFEVPRCWRGDCLLVRCEADGINRGYLGYFDTRVKAGLAGFVIGLYLDGDARGERLARGLAEEQQRHLTRMVELQKAKHLFPNPLASAAPLAGHGVCELRQALELNCQLMEGFLRRPGEAAPFFDRIGSFQWSVRQLEKRGADE